MLRRKLGFRLGPRGPEGGWSKALITQTRDSEEREELQRKKVLGPSLQALVMAGKDKAWLPESEG